MTDIITITEADLARLQSWEFEEVWRAVGYVFRRRAEASKTLPAVPPAIEPAPVPLAPVEAPPDVPPGGAPGEVSKRAEEYSLDIPDVEPASDFPASDDAPKSEPGEFTCPDCGQVFARAQGLASHRSIRHGAKGQDVHANGPRATTDPACPECGKVCTPKGIGTHRRIAHGAGQAMATCTDCGITMQAGALGQHRKFRHAAPTEPPPPEAHVHRYKLGSPAGDSVEGLCECGHRKLHPADLNGDISRNGKRSPNPKCPQCGKHALRDRHGYWCNGCQLEVKA